jgi:hypothetical protein
VSLCAFSRAAHPNDPQNIVLSLERFLIMGGGCYVERTCGAFEHRFKKYGLELPQLPKDYGQMTLLPI